MANSDSTITSLIRTAWRTAPPVLRRFAYGVWTVALVAVVLSGVADARNWWGGLQFTTNIIAELVCGLFALPAALVIIARLADYQVQELERVRLEARYGAALEQLTSSVRTTGDYVQELVQEVTDSTNAFVTAVRIVNGGLADPDAAIESAHLLQAQMDRQQWLFYERVVTPLRIDGNQLRAVFGELVRHGEQTAQAAQFERLWNDIEAVLRHHRQTMAAGYQEFARGGTPTANRATRMRNVAIEHLQSVDHLLHLCDELKAFANEVRPQLARADLSVGRPGR
ncbi:hypothetical protein Aph02nite_73020 [Actinoplanes philippinensis]|uniref:Uncharacterized protein n=1 Tax=Actinoplanes philippinensis TaxID=35752 RepID=A0A1I2JYW5_9ACTN|nr:hypothetical protein [Actinoplanes philippinensis]GIE81352.1 hypothetical protein Aph02nite_73020 [Actinoplanes philippinensis]SFF58117.1 hypothetical protein SAMN05421541_1148 [Actinoplanes philippinensis]